MQATSKPPVKVLDACSFAGSTWVFAAGLTNVEVVLTVTDTVTGATRRYRNPKGTAFAPVQDTSAFPRLRLTSQATLPPPAIRSSG